MANVVLQLGDQRILDTLRNNNSVIRYCHLYSSPHTPVVTDVDATYAGIEANFSGYAAADLGTWNAAFLNGSGQGEIDANQVTFTNSTGVVGNTIYGAYITDNAGHVVYAEQFSAPIVMTAAGQTFNYTPRLTCQTA